METNFRHIYEKNLWNLSVLGQVDETTGEEKCDESLAGQAVNSDGYPCLDDSDFVPVCADVRTGSGV